MKFRFPKSVRLRTRRQYLRLASHDARHIGHWVIVDIKTNQSQNIRLGITVSRRFGKAHLRNRFKRIVREAFRLCRQELRSGIDINVKPRSAAVDAKLADIQDDLYHFLKAESGMRNAE